MERCPLENHTFQRRACPRASICVSALLYAGWRNAFSVTVFDETPPDTARFGFAVTPDDAAGTYLFASCTKQQGDALWLYRTGEPADVPLRRLEMPPMRHLAGSDEQGFYWSAEGVLPAQAFRTAFGRVPRVGGILPGNAFLYDVSEPAFGAAFPVPTRCGAFPPPAGSALLSWCLIDRRVSFPQCSLFSPPHPLIPHLPAKMPAYQFAGAYCYVRIYPEGIRRGCAVMTRLRRCRPVRHWHPRVYRNLFRR